MDRRIQMLKAIHFGLSFAFFPKNLIISLRTTEFSQNSAYFIREKLKIVTLVNTKHYLYGYF